VLLSAKAIFAVVSGVLLIQTKIFILLTFASSPLARQELGKLVVYATNAKIKEHLKIKNKIIKN